MGKKRRKEGHEDREQRGSEREGFKITKKRVLQ